MSEHEKPAASNTADEREIEVRAGKTLQLTCPICHKHSFEQIVIRGDRKVMSWRKYVPTWIGDKLAKLRGTRWVQAYRCRHCEYIVQFARD